MRDELLEDVAVAANIFVVGPGHLVFARLDSRELVRRGHGERLEQQRVDEGEDRRVGPDGDGQREDRHRGKSGTSSHHTQTERNVLTELCRKARQPSASFDPVTMHGTAVRAGRLVSELAPPLRPRRSVIEPVAAELLGAHVEMKLKLLADVVAHVLACAGGKAEEPLDAAKRHRLPHAVSITLKTASA